MAIGIDDLDWEEVSQQPLELEKLQQPAVVAEEEPVEDGLTQYLKSNGIQDPTRIMFEDENNNIIERNWNDLTGEEQLNILASFNTPAEPFVRTNDNELSEEEIQFLTNVRNSGVSLNQYIESLKTPAEPHYGVDDLSDDEIYLLDLESRVGELTDEQLTEALTRAKQDEDLYKKLIEGIRKEYKEREDYRTQQDEAARELEAQERFYENQRLISTAIDNLTSVGNLDINLEDNDREDLAEFILSQDLEGVNYLERALQDPDTLVKVAWFLLNGDEAFNSIEDYFADLIKKVSESRYKQGYEDAKKGVPSKTVVISKPASQPVYNTIDDLDY